MRVVWLSHRDIEHPRAGGAEGTAFELSKRLCYMGHEVTWVTCSFPGSKAKAQSGRLRIIRLGGPVSAHLRALRLLRAKEFDVLVDDLSHVVPWATELMGSLPGTAYFRHLHHRTLWGQVPGPIAVALDAVERNYHRMYRRWPIVTESLQGMKDLEAIGFVRNRVTQIPPGVDSVRFHPTPKAGTPTIVYFGGFRRYKRPSIPVRVFDLLRSDFPGLSLLMVGDGPARAETETFARNLGLNGVRFLGRVHPDDLPGMVGSAWVNLHSSVAEGWGQSIIESSAAGTPSVGFAVPGVSETIFPETNGLLVPDENVAAMAAATRRVLGEPDPWVARSRAFASAFEWSKSTKQWSDHLKRVMDGGRAH